eukprot:SAG31_NODE_1400_length_8499_cov_2.809762_3_plen_180_part_00
MICVFADWLGPMAQGSYSDGCPWWLDPDLLPSFDVAVQAGITIAGSTVNVHLGSSELRLPLTIPWMDCGCNRGGWVWTFPALPPWGIVPLRDLCMVSVVTFSFLCSLSEKYGTFIVRCNALIEKVSPCRQTSFAGLTGANSTIIAARWCQRTLLKPEWQLTSTWWVFLSWPLQCPCSAR